MISVVFNMRCLYFINSRAIERCLYFLILQYVLFHTASPFFAENMAEEFEWPDLIDFENFPNNRISGLTLDKTIQ